MQRTNETRILVYKISSNNTLGPLPNLQDSIDRDVLSSMRDEQDFVLVSKKRGPEDLQNPKNASPPPQKRSKAPQSFSSDMRELRGNLLRLRGLGLHIDFPDESKNKSIPAPPPYSRIGPYERISHELTRLEDEAAIQSS